MKRCPICRDELQETEESVTMFKTRPQRSVAYKIYECETCGTEVALDQRGKIVEAISLDTVPVDRYQPDATDLPRIFDGVYQS